MHIEKSQVEHLAKLARLELTESEVGVLHPQLVQIVDFMEQLNAVDTEGIPPTSSVLDQAVRLRDDRPQAGLTVDEATANAPHTEDGYFLVPQILSAGDVEQTRGNGE